jgi:predicted kinase
LPWQSGMQPGKIMAGHQGKNTIYIFFGLIATGKSTLAEAWAESLHLPYYNSDRVRKQLVGLKEETSRREGFDQGIYSKNFSRRTYTALLERAAMHLQQGVSVVLDASYQAREERQRVRDLASLMAGRICFILCSCPETEMKKRMADRGKDPTAVSDGRWEIYLEQKKRFEPPDEIAADELIIIDTRAPVAQLLERLRDLVAAM